MRRIIQQARRPERRFSQQIVTDTLAGITDLFSKTFIFTSNIPCRLFATRQTTRPQPICAPRYTSVYWKNNLHFMFPSRQSTDSRTRAGTEHTRSNTECRPGALSKRVPTGLPPRLSGILFCFGISPVYNFMRHPHPPQIRCETPSHNPTAGPVSYSLCRRGGCWAQHEATSCFFRQDPS
ncbi:hypothetical protein APED_04190 [Acanthopleuribacter pedis]